MIEEFLQCENVFFCAKRSSVKRSTIAQVIRRARSPLPPRMLRQIAGFNAGLKLSELEQRPRRAVDDAPHLLLNRVPFLANLIKHPRAADRRVLLDDEPLMVSVVARQVEYVGFVVMPRLVLANVAHVVEVTDEGQLTLIGPDDARFTRVEAPERVAEFAIAHDHLPVKAMVEAPRPTLIRLLALRFRITKAVYVPFREFNSSRHSVATFLSRRRVGHNC